MGYWERMEDEEYERRKRLRRLRDQQRGAVPRWLWILWSLSVATAIWATLK